MVAEGRVGRGLRVVLVHEPETGGELASLLEAAGHAVRSASLANGVVSGGGPTLEGGSGAGGPSSAPPAGATKPDVAIVSVHGASTAQLAAAVERLRATHGVPVVVHTDSVVADWPTILEALVPQGVLVSPVSAHQLEATVQLAAAAGLAAATPDAVKPVELRAALERIRELLTSVGVVDPPAPPPPSPELGVLTTREREVLDAFVRQRKISRVAESLFISPHTVRNHLKSIYTKLDVHSQPELMVYMLAGRPH
jgi:DNA-binding NarL/FixJ family response regulator